MRLRKEHGSSIVESAATLALLLPMAMLLIYVVVEVSYAYLLKTGLAQGARQAARALAIEYGKNPTIAGSRATQDSLVFDKIKIQNIINSKDQFDDPSFDTSSVPHTVQVTVRYKGGQYGLPFFPHPDPLKLSSNFKIISESTYRLE